MYLRPAEQSDIPAIKSLSEGIWGGGDYLPRIIANWISEGGVYVGLVYEEIVGVSRIRKIANDEWWLEGLRIAVVHQGHGYGRELHNLTLVELKRIGKGVVRFASADTNRSIPPALKSGFREVLRLPFTFAELPHHHTVKHPWHSVLGQHQVSICHETSPRLKEILHDACMQDYGGLIRNGWEFYGYNAEHLTSWLAQGVVLTSSDEVGLTAAAVLSNDYQRPGNLDLNMIAGDETAVREQIIPSLVAAAMVQPKRYDEIFVCVPEHYRDVLMNAGFQSADFFNYQVVFEAEIAGLEPAY